MRLVWQLLAVAAIAEAGSQAVAVVQDNPWLTLVIGVATAVFSVLVYAWVVRRTEHRTVEEVAREGAAGAVGRGVLIGVVWFGVVIANIALLGDYHVHGIGSVTGAVGLVGFMAAAAVTEELLFRGVLFRIVEGRFGTWIALTATGVVFGCSHLLNKDATVWGAIAIALEAGGTLAAAYAATRNLWVPIGLHFGWNFAESGIFSTDVSGNGTTHGLLDSATSGSSLVTGGAFGPEASVYAVLLGALVTAAFLWLAHRRGRLVPLRRKAERAGAAATVAP
ncbi:CPBP family intramembrane glutamic endopeptidase [Streptomyces sp. NRRL F-5126]|uniref:CPBP family intramembrane glutamic endopeptidase n=1 Tax=Streptomyces sp. NRRL F-5126 TaxID=1463857 RepID=UPI0004C9948F|nr:CPBP family intramembrane glutamic endopeptidase [Streptomyces sp. NRRL F-5126]